MRYIVEEEKITNSCGRCCGKLPKPPRYKIRDLDTGSLSTSSYRTYDIAAAICKQKNAK